MNQRLNNLKTFDEIVRRTYHNLLLQCNGLVNSNTDKWDKEITDCVGGFREQLSNIILELEGLCETE